MDSNTETSNPIKRINRDQLSSEEAAYLWNLVYNNGRVLFYGDIGRGKILEMMGYFIPCKISKTCVLSRTNTFPYLNDNAIMWSAYSDTDVEDILEEFIKQRPTHIILDDISGMDIKQVLVENGYGILASTGSSNINNVLTRLQMEPINIDPSNLTILDTLVECSATEASNKITSIQEVIQEKPDADINIDIQELNDIEDSVAFEPEHRKHELKKLRDKKKLLDCLVKKDITGDQQVHTIIKTFNKNNPDDVDQWIEDNLSNQS